jgi:hypothetical protein
MLDRSRAGAGAGARARRRFGRTLPAARVLRRYREPRRGRRNRGRQCQALCLGPQSAYRNTRSSCRVFSHRQRFRHRPVRGHDAAGIHGCQAVHPPHANFRSRRSARPLSAMAGGGADCRRAGLGRRLALPTCSGHRRRRGRRGRHHRIPRGFPGSEFKPALDRSPTRISGEAQGRRRRDDRAREHTSRSATGEPIRHTGRLSQIRPAGVDRPHERAAVVWASLTRCWCASPASRTSCRPP